MTECLYKSRDQQPFLCPTSPPTQFLIAVLREQAQAFPYENQPRAWVSTAPAECTCCEASSDRPQGGLLGLNPRAGESPFPTFSFRDNALWNHRRIVTEGGVWGEKLRALPC